MNVSEEVLKPRPATDCDFIYNALYLYKKGIVLSSQLAREFYILTILKRGTADDVAKYTGRVRTIESRFLSKLNKLGIVARVKEGRKVYYVEPVTAVKEALEKYRDMPVEALAHSIGLRTDVVRDLIACLENKGEAR